MTTRKLVVSVTVLVCLLCIGIGIAYTTTNESDFFRAGQLFNNARQKDALDATGTVKVVTKYKNETISAAVVEYHKNMNILRDAATAERYSTDIAVINRIIENIILREESEQLGFSTTDAEIEEMVKNSVLAYSTPEGKEMIDAYCDGARITTKQYFELIREQAPDIIARQKLKNVIGKQYCEENGLQFTNVNPSAGMLEVQEAYIKNLFNQHKDDIQHFIDGGDVS